MRTKIAVLSALTGLLVVAAGLTVQADTKPLGPGRIVTPQFKVMETTFFLNEAAHWIEVTLIGKNLSEVRHLGYGEFFSMPLVAGETYYAFLRTSVVDPVDDSIWHYRCTFHEIAAGDILHITDTSDFGPCAWW